MAILGTIAAIRDEGPQAWGEYHLFRYLPDWRWQTWVILFLFVLLVALADGAYRLYQEVQDRGTSLWDAYDRPSQYQNPHPTNLAAWLAGILVLLVLVAWIKNVALVETSKIVKDGGEKKAEPTMKQDKDQLAPIAIFSDCVAKPFPIITPTGKEINIIFLNPKRIERFDEGFDIVRRNYFIFSNENPTDLYYPRKDVIRDSRKINNHGFWGYKCEVSNHSQAIIIEMMIPIEVYFDSESLKKKMIYRTIIGPLDPNAVFTFYIFNECDFIVATVLPTFVSVKVSGENTARKTQFHLKNPIDQIKMSFFPSKERWRGDIPCT
jgi:hypothetical protein